MRTPSESTSSIREISIAFRDGAAFAAYMHLNVPHLPRGSAPRASRVQVYRSKPVDGGYVIDFARNGRPIGIEVTSPATVTVAGVNRLLVELGLKKVTRKVLKPLLAA